MEKKDVVIIGGGPAGLAAALELYQKGIRDMVILEREPVHPRRLWPGAFWQKFVWAGVCPGVY